MDEKLMVQCPVCHGAGELSVLDEPIMKKAWEEITIPMLQEAIGIVAASGLLKDVKEPPSLIRKFILTKEDLAKQNRVNDFAQAAGVLRHISNTGSDFKLQGTTIIRDGEAMVITILFISQAAVVNGMALFGHPLKPYEDGAENDKT